MPLEEYRRKRRPGRTPEPVPANNVARAEPVDSDGGVFVVQEHHARRLHWDLRLERDGVLVSWAVPKGLPIDADTVRLAVRTEDHPIEYAEFSGEIPAGEYGAGRMTIWDHGRYQTIKWTDAEVQVELHGERARGRYVLLRKGRESNQWLLRRTGPPPDPNRKPLPRHISPMITTPGALPADDSNWCYEVRFGGTQVMVRVAGGRVTLTGPDGAELTKRYPEVAGLGASLGATEALFEAEIGGTPPGLWITDVLHLDGRDCLPLPYTERRALADALPLAGLRWRLSPSYPGGGASVVAAAAQQNLPSVVAKRADSAYHPGQRTPDWVQIATGAARGPVAVATRASAAAGKDLVSVEVAGRRVRLANPEKVLYPLVSFRKRDVLDYYLAVAPVMVPHLANRPVTLRRWPDGVEHPGFFEKNVSRHAPSWLRTALLAAPGSSRGTEALDYPLIDDEAGLAWVANLAALELHVPQWMVGPRGGRQQPDLLVFDLDPGEGRTIVDCARVAEHIADALAGDGLSVYPRTSGGKGIHLYSPVRVREPEQTSQYAKTIAERLARQEPAQVVAVMTRARRRGKVFIDWSQNNPAKTTVASYSLRGSPRPTVATPLTWEELRACRRPDDLLFTATDLPERLARHGDLLAPLLADGHRLPARPRPDSPAELAD